MKLLVPVYDIALVPAVKAAARAGGHIAAIVNPDSGPGKAGVLSEWKVAIAALRAAGAQVLYYVDLMQFNLDQGIPAPPDGKEKSLAEVKLEMDKYVNWYGAPVGWFFDDLGDYTEALAGKLKKLVNYKGGFTVGNPGTSDDATKKYLITGVTVLVTYETDGYLDSSPPTWEAGKGARLGAMALGEASFVGALELASQRNVNLFYATDQGGDDGENGGNLHTYNILPKYFKALSSAVAEI